MSVNQALPPPYAVRRALDGAWETTLRGRHVVADPRLNKGTAFTAAERTQLGLAGVIPPGTLTLDQQEARVLAQYEALDTDLARHVLLTGIRDRNQVLFYRLLTRHLREMLPIIYTPTVGEAIKYYSREYRKPHGLYLSVDHPELIEAALRATELGPGDVDLLVATDAEAILGIGDWGVGGIDIAVGKLAVYTAAGGIDPNRALPIMLDVGTNRRSLLGDPLYVGNRHERVPADVYDKFIDAYVGTASRWFPNALLHWEDFGTANAQRILDRYRERVLTFNDDIQGTGVANLAAVLSAARVTRSSLGDQRIVIFGAGSAGTGIADQLCAAMIAEGIDPRAATGSFWLIDRCGLITTDAADAARPAAGRDRYARPASEITGWARCGGSPGPGLAEVVARVHPSVLVGTSGQRGAFTEPIVRDMAAHTHRPVILPLSNPTSLAEATGGDLIRWTDGRALVASGSPFPPVTYDKTTYIIAQANNALVFPGLGLGVIAARATRVTGSMLLAAATALSELVDTSAPGAPLLPQVEDLRSASLAVAVAVARAARDAGVTRADLPDEPMAAIAALMWQPAYRPVRAI